MSDTKYVTPLPWQANGTQVQTTMASHRAVWTIADLSLADDGIMPRGEAEATAAFIAKACNAHAALVTLLDRIVECDLSTVRRDYNSRLLQAIADAHDYLAQEGL